MTNTRYDYLMDAVQSELTTDEIKQGWHWCLEFDGLLVGPGMGEAKHCKCYPACTILNPEPQEP